MNTPAFLATLRGRDIQVWAEGGQLRCSAPPGALSSEFRQELQQRKADILKFLDAAASLGRQQRAIVPLQPDGTRVPVFGVGGHNGDVFCYRALAHHLGDDQPFFGLQPPGLDGQSQPVRRVEDLAAYFAAQIKAFQPNGPYIVAGYCAGGAIAFELARQLQREGRPISVVALFGAPYATAYRLHSQIRLRLAAEWARVTRHTGALATLSGAERWSYVREKLKLVLQSKRPRMESMAPVGARPGAPDEAGEISAGATRASLAEEIKAQRIKVQRATFAALRRYTPSHFAGRLVLLLPSKAWARSDRHPLRWRCVADLAEEHFGPDECHTDVMLLEPYAVVFAELFKRYCATRVKDDNRPYSN